MRKDIFISYSNLDKEFVHKLARDLESKGIKVWLDRWDIPPGGNIVKEIDAGLKSSSQLLVIVSQNSLKSKWVEQEWTNKFGEEVRKEEIAVIPTFLGQIEEDAVPLILQGKSRINLSEDYEGQLDYLTHHIQKRRQEEFSKNFLEGDVQSTAQNAILNSIKNTDPRQEINNLITDTLSKLNIATGFSTTRKIKFIQREISYELNNISEQHIEAEKKHKSEPDALTLFFIIHYGHLKSRLQHIEDKIKYICEQQDSEDEILDNMVFELEYILSKTKLPSPQNRI